MAGPGGEPGSAHGCRGVGQRPVSLVSLHRAGPCWPCWPPIFCKCLPPGEPFSFSCPGLSVAGVWPSLGRTLLSPSGASWQWLSRARGHVFWTAPTGRRRQSVCRRGQKGGLGRPVGTGVGHSEGPGAPAPPGPLLSPSQPQPTGTRTGPWGPPLKACPPAGFPTLGCALCSHIGPECGIGKAHLPAPKPLSSHLQNGPQGNLAVGVVKTPGQTRRAAFSARPLRGLTHRPGEGGWGDGRRAAPQASHHPPSPGYAGQGRAGRRARTRWREGWYLAYRGEGVCGGWASRASAPCPPTSRRERPVATVPQERRVPPGCR